MAESRDSVSWSTPRAMVRGSAGLGARAVPPLLTPPRKGEGNRGAVGAPDLGCNGGGNG